MSRNLFIGLGGCGIKTIDEIKQLFINADSTSNVASAFCAIDNDIYSLQGCRSLSKSEKIHIDVQNPYSVYYAHKDKFDDIPNKNVDHLYTDFRLGSGQCRSNGHFCFQCNEDVVRRQIQRAYYELSNPSNVNVGRNTSCVDIHIFFSLCGGTGSGIFYDVAKLVKEIIPNSNIACYAYSHNFFTNIFPHWDNIKANTYAALLELDNCFNNRNYFNPFDKFVYIDTRLFSCSYVLRADDLYNIAIPNVAKGVTISLKYDSPIGDNPRDNKWISSMGFSEIPADELCWDTDKEEQAYEIIYRMLVKASPLMDTKDGLASLCFNEFHHPHTVVIMGIEHKDVIKAFQKTFLGEGIAYVFPSKQGSNKIMILRSLATTELSHVVGIDELEGSFIYNINNVGFRLSPFTTKDFDSNLAVDNYKIK